MDRPSAITIRLPGEPIGQGRPRAAVRGGFATIYDPPESRKWKATAQAHYLEALRVSGVAAPLFPAGPVELHLVAVFTCPQGDFRKTSRFPRRPSTKAPDMDNVLKIVMDAGLGVLWLNDAQVARTTAEKWIGEPGEAPYLELTLASIDVPPAIPIVPAAVAAEVPRLF